LHGFAGIGNDFKSKLLWVPPKSQTLLWGGMMITIRIPPICTKSRSTFLIPTIPQDASLSLQHCREIKAHNERIIRITCLLVFLFVLSIFLARCFFSYFYVLSAVLGTFTHIITWSRKKSCE
jgi:hypothetical protein